jgi:diguanylate cyclase (GGDEF)-like protein
MACDARTVPGMTTSVRQGAIDPHATPASHRSLRADGPARFVARVARSLWLRDRAVAELRWAAMALTVMSALALIAKALDPADPGFDRAILVMPPLALAAIAVGWSPKAAAVMGRRHVRQVIGPAVLVVALLCAGSVDVATLARSPAAPLIWLALSYAAITPGFPIALAISVGITLGAWVGHELLVAAEGADVVRDEFVLTSLVVFLAASGMFLVVRVAAEAERRAMRMAARSRARVDALETLERIDRHFDGSRPLRDVAQSVVEDVSNEFQVTLVSLYVPTGDGRLTMVGVAGYHSPFHVIEIGLGVIGRAASTQTTQFVPDVLADRDYRAARDDVRSEVAAPIVHDGELLGVVNFEGTLARPLTTSHVALAELLARSIAASLRSARLDEERRDRLHAIGRVLEVSRLLVSDLDRGRMARAVVDAAADLLTAEHVLIAGRAPDDTFILEHETPAAAMPGRALGPDDSAAIEAIATGQPVVTVDAEARSTVALPIQIDGEVASVLVASRPAGAPAFGPVERGIADLLVTQVAVALRNADRHARVSDAAVRDPLTGLLNRRYFDEAVETAFATARRLETPLSLIVLDLDRFSAVNNDHGHAVGDAVLRRVARAMAGAVRVGDTTARYGGEEFVVIAPGADTAEAVVVAERIRSAVAAASTVGTDAQDIGITVSAGVASLIGDELDGRALFRAADSALLAAKRAGRDRVATL